MSAKSTNCGSSIEVKWKWIGQTMENYLMSSVDRSGQKFVFSVPRALPSRTIHGLMSNTDYEVWLRAVNYYYVHETSFFYWYSTWYKKNDYGDWTKKQLRTVAGYHFVPTLFSISVNVGNRLFSLWCHLACVAGGILSSVRGRREATAAEPPIGHFRVVFCLCFKTSPSAKPFI